MTIAALDNEAEFTAEAATACEALVATEEEAPTAALAPAVEVFWIAAEVSVEDEPATAALAPDPAEVF